MLVFIVFTHSTSTLLRSKPAMISSTRVSACVARKQAHRETPPLLFGSDTQTWRPACWRLQVCLCQWLSVVSVLYSATSRISIVDLLLDISCSAQFLSIWNPVNVTAWVCVGAAFECMVVRLSVCCCMCFVTVKPQKTPKCQCFNLLFVYQSLHAAKHCSNHRLCG